jgi:hypothetical protein
MVFPWADAWVLVFLSATPSEAERARSVPPGVSDGMKQARDGLRCVFLL